MNSRFLQCVFVVAGFLLLSTVSGWAFEHWPDTGQTKCYDNEKEIPCPTPGQSFYGQDAQYQGPARSYTKLDSAGNDLPSSSASWTMVCDNVTGLIWEMKTSDGGIHDKDNEYTWCDTNPETNGGDSGTCGNGTDTEDFIKSLNDAAYGGFTDWRLPTVKELSTLVDSSIPDPSPSIDSVYFPNTMLSWYWSSTTNANYSYVAWSVDFGDGYVYSYGKNGGYGLYVRAVRGGQCESLDHLIINGDGTVTDTETGLMWQQETASARTWEAALQYCENLTLADHDDWRLPNRNELQSLVDYRRYNPAIDTAYFPGTVPLPSWYWSSTTNVNYSDYGAWLVDFGYGYVSYVNKNDSLYVRAVRGGSGGTFDNLVIAQSPMSGPPGTTFTQWGTGFTPSSTATLHFQKPDGSEYPTAQQAIDSIGHFETTYTAPMDKPPGTYTWWAIDGPTGGMSNKVS